MRGKNYFRGKKNIFEGIEGRIAFPWDEAYFVEMAHDLDLSICGKI